MRHLKTIVIPVVVGALSTVKKEMIENIEKVSKRANVTERFKRSACRNLRESLERYLVSEQKD